MELTDKESHYIQNEIDLLMDQIRDENAMTTEDVLIRLEEIRDSIPCCCDSDIDLVTGQCMGNKYGYPVDK